MDEALEAAGMFPMKEYIRIWQPTIAEYIANCPIYEVCTGLEWVQGSRRFLQWWDQYITREEERYGAARGYRGG